MLWSGHLARAVFLLLVGLIGAQTACGECSGHREYAGISQETSAGVVEWIVAHITVCTELPSTWMAAVDAGICPAAPDGQ